MKKLNYFGGILLGIALVSAIVYISSKQTELESNGRYTIGETHGQNGKFIRYTFKVERKEFSSEYPILKFSPLVNGGRYYVKYLPSDLSISEIYWDKPVPDHIVEAPLEGWSRIPQ